MAIPKKIRLEACAMCQLKCPMCETPGRKKDPGVVGWGYLKFEDFKELLENNPSIKAVELAASGEIFLNPDIREIMKHAFKSRVALTANGGVNLNNVSEDILHDLVKYRFTSMMVAMDGACQETYVKYRQGGDFEKVISNIVTINRYKKQYRDYLPALLWQFIVFGHNEHEIPIARNFAKKLGMSFATKLSWDANYSPIKNKEFVKSATGNDFTTREEFVAQYGRHYMDGVCGQLWGAPTINWDGKLLGCCRNRRMSFGNVFESGLEEVLNTEKYLYMKEMVAGKKPPREDIVCVDCSVFKIRNRKK